MIRPSTAAIASTVLARHMASQQKAPATPAKPTASAGSGGLRQVQVLQSRSEPAQLTLQLGRR
ncbi:MAG: hypothetical protein KatS3mg122_1978 [Caldimonas sp.]|nr:MAG: hypothetical protein KatS3mg122_1978 [Caldimonas sp.]